MMRSAVFASTVVATQGAHYAVLVAGSNGYRNYRHQADVCHAYQVVKANGISDQNIVVMAYDDIANDSHNVFPGQLFNKPTAAGVAGTDVYAGCKIDYSGKDVTPENFEAVLTGTATGKNINPTAKDNVFVYFADHGATGLIAFPSSTMHKADLQSALSTMKSKNRFNKLTFYLETCESGSMFEGMDIEGVYALSAASPSESSWATYCGDDATVDGKSIVSCLGDLFSVNWMEDSDAMDITAETLAEQAATVTTKTSSKSKVMQWGDLTFQSDKVSNYQGVTDEFTTTEPGPADAISYSARQVDLQQAYYNYVNAKNSKERLAMGAELQKVIQDQIAVETAYENFLNIIYPSDSAKQHAARSSNAPANQKECEMAARRSFEQHGAFDSFSGFSLQFQKYVVNVCADLAESGTNVDVAEAAKQACAGTTLV